jgi:hypothetical protein
MNPYDEQIRNIKTRRDAEALANSLMLETTKAQHVAEGDHVWERAEHKLLVFVLLCTSVHCPPAQSALSYAIGMLTRKTAIAGDLATTDDAKAARNEFTSNMPDSVRARVFAGLTARLKSLGTL